MARTRPKVSAKQWASQEDNQFERTVFKKPEGMEIFSPQKEGNYKLEIIPYFVPKSEPDAGPNPNADLGDYYYERTFFVHRDIGADGNMYVCSRKTAGKPCPVCEYRDKLLKDKTADEDLIASLAPKQRQLWNVFNHDEEEKGVQLWEVSYHNFGKQLKKEIRASEEDDGYEYFADPEDGFTLRVYMEETSFAGNSFYQASTIAFKARKEPLPDTLLDAAYVLDELLIIQPYDKFKRVFLQEESNPSEREEGTQEEPRPRRERRQEDKKEEPKKSTPKFVKGDEVSYKGENYTVLKVLSEDLVNLISDDDDIVKGVSVEDLAEPMKMEKKAEKEPEQTPTKKQEKASEPKEEEPQAEEGQGDEDGDWDVW